MSTNPKGEVFASLARVGTALSSPTRIGYLELLAQAERSVEQLASLTGTTIANTSQHLQKLRQAGLIVGRKQGVHVFYRLSGDEVVGLLSAISRVGETYLADVERIVRLYFVQKDALEQKLLGLVCDGTMTVKQAQSAIKKNWVQAYTQYVGAAATRTGQ
jgi:DNA-binding transcriptional ArsR family regulator